MTPLQRVIAPSHLEKMPLNAHYKTLWEKEDGKWWAVGGINMLEREFSEPGDEVAMTPPSAEEKETLIH